MLPESIYFPELSSDHLRGKTIYVRLQDKCISDVVSATSILSIETNLAISHPKGKQMVVIWKGKTCLHFTSRQGTGTIGFILLELKKSPFD